MDLTQVLNLFDVVHAKPGANAMFKTSKPQSTVSNRLHRRSRYGAHLRKFGPWNDRMDTPTCQRRFLWCSPGKAN